MLYMLCVLRQCLQFMKVYNIIYTLADCLVVHMYCQAACEVQKTGYGLHAQT